jgi:hypothetical protein
MPHNGLTVAAVKKTESEDIAPMTRDELIDLEMKTRAAVADTLIAKTNLGIVAIVTKKKCHLVTRVARLMPSLEVLVDLKNREPRAIAATTTCDHANPAGLKSLPRVASPKKTRAESAKGDPLVLMLTDATEPTRLSQVHLARLPEHPDETVASLPTIVLEALAADVEQQMNRPLTIDAKKGQSDEQERKLTEDASLHVTVSQDKRKRRGRGRGKGEARAKSLNASLSPSLSHNQSPRWNDNIAAHVVKAIPVDLGMKSPRSAHEKNQSRLRRSYLPPRTLNASWMLLPHLVRRIRLQSQSENAQEMSRQRTHPSGPRHDIDVLVLQRTSRALDHRAVHVMTLSLNHRGIRTGTERGQETRKERETGRKSPGLSSTSGWTQRTPAAKRDTKSDVGHK